MNTGLGVMSTSSSEPPLKGKRQRMAKAAANPPPGPVALANQQPTTERFWYDADNNRSNDEKLLKWIKEDTAKSLHGEVSQLIVGTDSHLHGRQWRFVTVVCVYNPGLGGNYMMHYSYEPREKFKKNTPSRMFFEVGLSIQVADWLLEQTGFVSEIHIDASEKGAGEFTSAFSDQLVGYAKSSGYVGQVKPNSWVASSVSDRHTK